MPKTILKPTTIKEELEEIRKDNGGLLDPVLVVEYARDQRTLLHNKFEWDDSIAGEQYRIWQARQIIRLELTVINKQNNGDPIRTYVSLIADRKSENEKGYRSLIDVLSDEEMRSQLLEEAKRDMDIFKRKYRMLKELSEVFEAMDRVQ